MKTITLFVLALALGSGALAARPAAIPADYGQPAATASTGRIIDLTPNTKYVNLTNGETVQFTMNGKQFGWHVSTYPGLGAFDLKQIAPPGIEAGKIRVYVAPNPLYLGP